MKKIPNYLIVIIIISSLLNIASYFSLKDRIFSIYKNKIQKANVIDLGTGQEETINDIFWANEIKKGGYFLFFRHAHRDKWDESVNYLDNYALTNKIDEKKSTFHEGTCLSVPRGVEGARIMGEFFRYFNIKIYNIQNIIINTFIKFNYPFFFIYYFHFIKNFFYKIFYNYLNQINKKYLL
jgi:hypothetical protein